MTYDERQTELCNKLRDRLQSIAILAVAAQDLDPSGDPLQDMLSDIETDLEVARNLSIKLNVNEV